MIQIFHDVNIDWLGKRRIFIALSITFMLIGLGSALYRYQVHPHGTEAFNLGVDFKGGTVITVRFKQPPTPEAIESAILKTGVSEAVIQPILDRPGEFLIRIPKQAAAGSAEAQTGVDVGRARVGEALKTFGEGNAEVVGTDAVGEVAGKQLRTQAVAVTLAALVGMLVFIALRFEWTYGAAAVLAVLHTVLVTLGIFSIFQIEINLTVIAAMLTLVGFDVNDSIVVFDRIRENRKLHRRMSLYEVTNLSINQTLSRTVITSGLVFLSVIALVLFGGAILRPFSLALMFGIIFGTYSSIAIASPIMVWWEQRLQGGVKSDARVARGTAGKIPPRPAKDPNQALAAATNKRSHAS